MRHRYLSKSIQLLLLCTMFSSTLTACWNDKDKDGNLSESDLKKASIEGQITLVQSLCRQEDKIACLSIVNNECEKLDPRVCEVAKDGLGDFPKDNPTRRSINVRELASSSSFTLSLSPEKQHINIRGIDTLPLSKLSIDRCSAGSCEENVKEFLATIDNFLSPERKKSSTDKIISSPIPIGDRTAFIESYTEIDIIAVKSMPRDSKENSSLNFSLFNNANADPVTEAGDGACFYVRKKRRGPHSSSEDEVSLAANISDPDCHADYHDLNLPPHD